MKNLFVSNSTRSSILRTGFAFLLLLNLSSAFAHETPKGDEPFVSVKYAGSSEGMMQFQFDMVNDNDESYLLTIQDQDGLILYKEKVSKKVFTRKFAWNNNDFIPAKLIFSVTGDKSKTTQTYEVNTQVRTVRDVEISKL